MKRILCTTAILVSLAALPANLAADVPSGGPIRLLVPTRMVKDKTLTLRADILDQYGPKARIDWRKWSLLGTVSARRVSDGSDIPLSITVFEEYYKGAGGGTPPEDSIRFYNGVGCVSFTIDSPTSLTGGEQIEVCVTADGKTASKVVTVLDNTPATYTSVSGTLSGAGLTWSPEDGVIRLTGQVTVATGSTLTILPSTLIMGDKGQPSEGMRINVSGNIQVQGTEDEPVYFFATEGPAAMQLIPGNDDAWGGIYHSGAATSTYSYAIITGGGNGYTGQWHLYPPLLRFYNSHSLTMSHCVLADSAAKLILGDYGSGTFHLADSLLTRSGFGATFGSFDEARAHMSVTFEDTWITRVGRGDEASDWDGDAIHWNSDSTSGLVFNRCVITDVGDDCVDGSDTFYIKTYFNNTIAYDLDDKLTTYWPGDAYAYNLLLFACNKGFESVNGYPTQSTMADVRPFPQDYGGDWWVEQSIAAPGGTQSGYTCTRFSADYTMLANEQHVECGTGNIWGDPLFVDPMTGDFPPDPEDYKSSYDYNLQPGSPALTAGPNGERIGWLGFPAAEPCLADADCQPGGAFDDDNPCTTDTCEVGVCKHTLIDQCIACLVDGDCDYGDPCVVGTCQGDGTCAFATADDGTPCDDGFFCTGVDTCQSGECVSPGNPCAPLECDEVTDQCGSCTEDEECDDGNYCNGEETCDGEGHCQSGIDPCDDSVYCTDDTCDEEGDLCSNTPNDANCPDDGFFCNGTEFCDSVTDCGHTGNPCQPDEFCNEALDACISYNDCQLQATGPIAGPSPNQYRWKDIAGVGNSDHNYSASYQATYTYEDPTVVVTLEYQSVSETFQGTLTATNLKPNFAYQMKIVTNPTAKYVSELSPAEYRTLHNVASIGRWWDATTDQINPPYDSTHQMQSYLLFDHFETDNFGNVEKTFYADSSFHVLFDTASYYNPVTSTVNPAGPPANDVAYDEPYPESVDVTVSAQNEQGTPGSTFLSPGHYEGMVFLLTEESFHESGAIGGYWASAMACDVAFDIVCDLSSECDDGVDCTVDECVNHVCVSTPDNGACTDDGLFCNGDEICDEIDGCVHAGDPCAPAACYEETDTCEDIECFEDEDCDDGAWCNGAETCIDNECISGVAPCNDSCEQCDEANDECDWCRFDLDRDTFVGPGDFSFFAGCYGQSYGCDAPEYRTGAEQCCISNFDQSSDSFIGPGDFAGFAGCFGSYCDECETCWGMPGSGKSAVPAHVNVAVVPVREWTTSDSADALPQAATSFLVGSTLYAEVWANVAGGDFGLAAVHVDVTYDATRMTLESVTNGEWFSLFARDGLAGGGTLSQDGTGRITAIGGCSLLGESQLGLSPTWVRVATLSFHVNEPGAGFIRMSQSSNGYGVAVLNRFGVLDSSELTLDSSHVQLVSRRTLDRTSKVPSFDGVSQDRKGAAAGSSPSTSSRR